VSCAWISVVKERERERGVRLCVCVYEVCVRACAWMCMDVYRCVCVCVFVCLCVCVYVRVCE